jgi:hypothetical protein
MSDADDQLRKLGYRPSFERSMNLWENFALGFTYLSPVVGVYTLFSMSLAVGGAPFLWSYLIVGAGRTVVPRRHLGSTAMRPDSIRRSPRLQAVHGFAAGGRR